MQQIFNRKISAINKVRYSKAISYENGIQNKALEEFFTVLSEINTISPVKTSSCLIIGDSADFVAKILPFSFEKITYFTSDEEDLLTQNLGKFDMILSFFNLHKVNKIKPLCDTFRQMLNVGGVLCGSLYSLDNLLELKNSLLEADLRAYNRAYPRVLPFIDLKTTGMLLQSVGFRNISCVNYKIQKEFKDAYEICKFIKNQGEANCLKDQKITLTTANLFFNLNQILKTKYSNVITFDINCFLAYK